MNYTTLTKEKLEQLLEETNKEFNSYVKKGLKLDISRGKPCNEQLDIGIKMYDMFDSKTAIPKNYRNYGMLDGIPEMKGLFAEMLGVSPANVIVGGNSSLNLMYDCIQRAMQFGLLGEKPWNQSKVKFLCPVPGYDRHFAITEHFGIEMINIPMNENGPRMDIVEKIVALDDSIKGIWCVPKYSNPTGVTYSKEVVEALAKMETKAKDFRIFWDNAYCVHDLYEETEELANIMQLAEKYGHEDRIYEFTSTSKITLAGSGVGCMAASERNIKEILSHMTIQTISYNKIDQYIHYLYLKDMDNIKAIMAAQRAIIKPKFDTIITALEENFTDSGIASWTNPKGGYFITLDVYPNCAKKVHGYCKEAGLTLTGAGAPFPYKKDDDDKTLRIAPTFTSDEDLIAAKDILVCCVKKACIEKLLED